MPTNDTLTSYVMLSDTFDQWRMKTNEWLSMTNEAGSSNFIKTNEATNSTSNTTGSITTAGGLGTGSSVTIAENVTLHTDSDLRSTTNFKELIHVLSEDADEFTHILLEDGETAFPEVSREGYFLIELPNYVDIDGSVQIDGATTVGVDGTGRDVKFFGDTSAQYMLWDQSADELILNGDTKLSFHDGAGGENIVASSDGHLEINAGTTLDITAATVDVNASTAVNVDAPTQINNTVTVGVDDTGYDVIFYGATSGAYMKFDQSSNDLEFAGAAAISIDTTTDSSNTTTGSFHTDGGVGIAKKLYVGTHLDVDGTTNLDAVDIDDTVQIDNTVTVGADEAGFDVKFFGDTSSSYMLWDTSADDLILAGAAALSIDNTTDASSTTTGSFHTDGGAGIALKLFVCTDLDVDGTTNLDAVDIDSTTQIDNTVSVGTNGSGQDVKFFGATSGNYWQWDASADKVIQIGSSQLTGALTVGVDDTGHDVKFFGASAGAFMLYDESEDTLEIRGPSADATTSSGKLKLSTSLTDINDGDVIGSIGFKAPLEAGSGDAILIGASIFAEADATFSSSVNSTDLVFATGDSEAASEKVRIDSTGQVTFADGAIDVDIASHDGTNGLKLGGTLVTATAANLNDIPNEVNLGKCIAFSIVMGNPD